MKDTSQFFHKSGYLELFLIIVIVLKKVLNMAGTG